MMVGRHPRYITSKVGHLDILFDITFESSIQYFALARFQAINNRRNRSHVISHTEEDKLLVNKIGVSNFVGAVIQVGSRFKLTEPFFSFIRLLFRESEINELGLIVLHRVKFLKELVKVAYVALEFI